MRSFFRSAVRPLIAGCLAAGVLALPAAAAILVFAPAVSYPTGVGPVSLALGNLNNDSHPDIATANASQTVSVLLNNGSGGFGPATNFGVGSGPTGIVAADFNHDNHADIAVTDRNIGGPGSVSVLLGDGTGNFGPAANFATQDGPFGIATGDLNDDGNRDLVVVSGTAGVLFGDGTGAFAPAVAVSPFTGALGVATGTLNGDAHLDIVTANFYNPTVSVLLGDGTGHFAAPVDFGVGSFPVSVAIGDVNEDTRADIVAVNGGSDTVTVLLGNGAGGFASAGDFATGHQPSMVAIGDLNLDGHVDLAVSNSSTPGSVSVLLGDGTGHFAAPMDFAVGNGATAIGLGDLNGDGRADAVTSNYFSYTASVLLNQTRSGFDLSPCRLGCKQHITLTKDFVPNPNDPNVSVDLRINDILVAGRVSDGGTSGPIGVEPGIYVVSETGTALKRYIGSVLCTGESSASSLPHTLTVAKDANLNCVVTNRRK
jgi:hypothetical protein